ncbi:hypothetical protein SDC9_89250 [bioreactor metagenome]|uniref:Uncharacterized protein n=1 Tax=bioreactor metagenome TaxID=1076179 RepID=A0A644ZYE8_9ZZZZ
MALEILQARDQPHRRKAGPGGDGHVLAPGRLAHHAHGSVEPLQRRGEGLEQLTACRGELYRTRVAQEQRHAHFFLQRLDLAADGGLRERHFIRRHPEVQMPGHGHECAPVAHRHGARAQMRNRRRRWGQ